MPADDDTDSQCEQLFAAVVTAREGDKDLSAPFKVLPPKSVSCFFIIKIEVLKLVFYKLHN